MRPLSTPAALLLALLLGLGGCINLGPDYQKPEAPAKVPQQYQHGRAETYVENDQWWRDFGDPGLNKLVIRALRQNWDIKLAAARVLEVEALFTQAGSARYPSLALEAGGTTKKSPRSVTLANNVPVELRTEAYNLNLAASFEVDLWGRLKKAEAAALFDLIQSRENRRTVVQGLIAEVVSSYLQIEALERRLWVARRSREAFAKSLELVEARYTRGLTNILDLRQARRALAVAKAAVPEVERELGLQQQALSLLAGEYPGTSPARVQPLDYLPNLQPVPAGLPSELLLRRPDIRAAEASLKALTSRVGVAKAARFPSLSLTGSLGYSSDGLGRLFTPSSSLWSLSAGLTQSIFDAGRLEAAQRQAEARLKQGEAEYAKAVLAAFKEVESALLTRKKQFLRRRLAKEALVEAIATQEAALTRYQRGLTDYLQVLEAQRARYSIEESLILTELALVTNRVTLYRALGGGWDAKALEQARKGSPKDE